MPSKTIPAIVRKEIKETILKGGMEQPKLAEVAQQFFALTGGARGVAKLLLDEFRKADCTPATRTRIIDLMLNAVKDTQAQFDAVDNVGLLTDDDLEKMLESRMKKLAEKMVDDA